ncbi:MAG: hypothetical protein HXY34_08825 [Candidatus Thorarchaeota archaeon]|nr:hypothetical protein [Candidatus Thorarchaeota archaeon]
MVERRRMVGFTWNADANGGLFARPSVHSLLAASVVSAIVVGTVSQCLTISYLLSGAPEFVHAVLLGLLVLVTVSLVLDEAALVYSYVRFDDWLATALSAQICDDSGIPDWDDAELWSIMLNCHKRSKIAAPLLVLGLTIVLLSLMVPWFHLGEPPSLLQIVILVIASSVMCINLVLDIALGTRSHNHIEMSESARLHEIHAVVSRFSGVTMHYASIDDSPRNTVDVWVMNLTYILVFLWIGITDLLFLI